MRRTGIFILKIILKLKLIFFEFDVFDYHLTFNSGCLALLGLVWAKTKISLMFSNTTFKRFKVVVVEDKSGGKFSNLMPNGLSFNVEIGCHLKSNWVTQCNC